MRKYEKSNETLEKDNASVYQPEEQSIPPEPLREETTDQTRTYLDSSKEEVTPLESIRDLFDPLEILREELKNQKTSEKKNASVNKVEDSNVSPEVPKEGLVPTDLLTEEPISLEVVQRQEERLHARLLLRIKVIKQRLESTKIPITSKKVLNSFTRQLEYDRDQYARSVDKVFTTIGQEEEMKGGFIEKLVELIEQASCLLEELHERSKRFEPTSLEKLGVHNPSSKLMIQLYLRTKEALSAATFRLKLIEEEEKNLLPQAPNDAIQDSIQDLEEIS